VGLIYQLRTSSVIIYKFYCSVLWCDLYSVYSKYITIAMYLSLKLPDLPVDRVAGPHHGGGV
jgi:hypothetical protein